MRINQRNLDMPLQNIYVISDKRLADDSQALIQYMASIEPYAKGCEKARRRRRLAECARKQRSQWV